ncbi:phosphoglycolate phosphatase 1 [Marinobacterium zhoushanense]|uniref:Phosphoglycolate phosphatase n=1 Tax=Marinobacterium zhoushanense TaxID=1679163 RepID=A0ABQ1K5A3_9GAMM|nr:phosphoglycolate phosphatase [Marinobacterium zhoushanense]GGB83794.1 phosphoglycolate phosphatase 1 [Marinobacterium zhoushanense]
MSRSEHPALVMFDLDGTLVDSVPDLTRAVDQMLAALGRAPAGEHKVRRWVGNGAGMLVRRALADAVQVQADPENEELFPIAQELFMTAYAQANGRTSSLYPGVDSLLKHYRREGVPMALVTNKPGGFTHSLLDQLQLSQYFPVVVAGDTLKQKKPSPAPLLHACDRSGVLPGSALMIGDSRVDVEAARAAGCPVICVSYGYNRGEPIHEAGADRVIDSLAELLAVNA